MQNPRITDIKVDGGCDLNRTIVHSFGNLLIFIFYSEVEEKSKKFLESLQNSIPIFGQHDNVQYYSLSLEKCPETLKKFGVSPQNLPSVVFTQMDRKIIHRYEGEDLGLMFSMIETTASSHKTQFQTDKIVWHPKVKSILEGCPFLVFIKGTPQNPKCGFTRSLLEILKNLKIEYSYFDISENAELGNWTRNYSKWLTFPQVYIKGKLVGGLDVTKQLIAKGQFEKMVPNSCRQSSPEEKYQNYVEENQTAVFIEGFTFENEVSNGVVNEAKGKYGQNVSVFNIGIDAKIRNYIIQSVSKQIPFIVHKKQVVKRP